jgi:hypothetical protein
MSATAACVMALCSKGAAMWKPKIGWLKIAAFLAVAFIAVGLLGPLAQITYNLNVRAEAARKLAQALHERHPTLEFDGGAGYEGKHIFFSVKGNKDDKARKDIMDWIEQQQRQRGGQERVTLVFRSAETFDTLDYRYEPGSNPGWQEMTDKGWREVP